MKAKVPRVLLVFLGLWSSPAAADNRIIVRASSGLAFLQQTCLLLGCTVPPAGGIDGALGRVFLVTTPDLLDPNAFLQILRSQPGIEHVERDAQLKVMQSTAAAPPSGLWDTVPVTFYGATVIHGYVSQPAHGIIPQIGRAP